MTVGSQRIFVTRRADEVGWCRPAAGQCAAQAGVLRVYQIHACLRAERNHTSRTAQQLVITGPSVWAREDIVRIRNLDELRLRLFLDPGVFVLQRRWPCQSACAFASFSKVLPRL